MVESLSLAQRSTETYKDFNCKNFLQLPFFVEDFVGQYISAQGAHTIYCVADCYFIVNVLDLPFDSPIAIYR